MNHHEQRKLLELVAHAMGPEYSIGMRYSEEANALVSQDRTRRFNPITNKADAFDLMVKLQMRVEPWGAGAAAVVFIDNVAAIAEPHYGDNPEAATMLAITRAAAAIGKQMKEQNHAE